MPRPRFNNLPEERRRELLEAAGSEFAVHGHEGASLNNIIAGVGLSKGAFYYYFDDKADLFGAVVEHCLASVQGDSSMSLDQLDRSTFWPLLEEWSITLTRRMRQFPWLAALGKLFYEPPQDVAVKNVVGGRLEWARGWLGAILKHGREQHAVRSDEPLDLQRAVVAGALEGSDRWFIDQWEVLTEAEIEAMISTLFLMVKRMVGHPELLTERK